VEVDTQKAARLFGWFFIATFVASIPARFLFMDGLGADWQNARFVPGATNDTSLYFGAMLEFLLVGANIATAIVLYPIVKRHHERLGLGYVAARITESAFILVGLVSIISVVSVADALAGASGAEATALAVQGNSLVETYEWAFQFGPGLVVGFGNGLILGYLMYRTGLVPRRMAMLGLVGGPLLIISFVFILFGAYENGSAPSFFMALPEIAWEASLGVYAAWKGFRTPKTIDLEERAPKAEPSMAAV
jgi:Domain of unknown function (DUF4386)